LVADLPTPRDAARVVSEREPSRVSILSLRADAVVLT
jgi:hypothetical protein